MIDRPIEHRESGLALVVTLVLLLTLTIMAASVSQVVNRHSEMIDNISYRPVAMEAANACVDMAFDWLATLEGELWRNGAVSVDLASPGKTLNKKTVLDDTTRPTTAGGAARATSFVTTLGKAYCTKVRLTKLSEGVVRGEGSEIGSESTYGSSFLKYVIKIETKGVFNVPTNAAGTMILLDEWSSSSNLVDIEVVAGYEPS